MSKFQKFSPLFSRLLDNLESVINHPAAQRLKSEVDDYKKAWDQDVFHLAFPEHSDRLNSLLGKSNLPSDDELVPSAPKVKDEGPDFDESSDTGEGPDFEEHTEAPSDKRETPALSAPVDSPESSPDSIRDKVNNLINEGAPAADLRSYAKELGVEVGPKSTKASVRKRIFEHFNIGTSSKSKPSKVKEEVKTEEAPPLEEEAPPLEEVSPQQEVNDIVDDEPEPEVSEDNEVPLLEEEEDTSWQDEVPEIELDEEGVSDTSKGSGGIGKVYDPDDIEFSDDFGSVDNSEDELSDFDKKIYSPEMGKMLHGRGLEYPGWLVHEYKDGQITEEEGELLLEDYIEKKGLKNKKDKILQSFKSKIQKSEDEYDDSEERIQELDALFDLKLDKLKNDPGQSEESEVLYNDMYDDELDENPEFNLENDPTGEEASDYIVYNQDMALDLSKRLIDKYLERSGTLSTDMKRVLNEKGVNSVREQLAADLIDSKILKKIAQFFAESGLSAELKNSDRVKPILNALADYLMEAVPSNIRELNSQEFEMMPSLVSRMIRQKALGRIRSPQEKRDESSKRKEASNFSLGQDDYLVNKMSGLNCKRIKIWASEINSMGTQRVVVKVGWNKEAVEGVYPWNISHAIRTYIHSLEAANYVQDENLGLVGYPRIVGLDLDKCEAKVIVPCTNATSFPPVLVEGTAAVERRIKI